MIFRYFYKWDNFKTFYKINKLIIFVYSNFIQVPSLIVSREYNAAKTQFQKGFHVSNLNPLYRLTDYRHPERAFFQKSRTFGLGQTFWAEIFWSIWGIFGRTISTHFGTVSSLSMFSIIQPLFLQKTKPLYPTPKYLFGSGIWIWAAKNLRFSLRVSVVRALFHSSIFMLFLVYGWLLS